jgi:integrase/recombinase XerD
LSIVEKEAVVMTQWAPGRVRVIGPLAGFADGFGAHLGEQGYSLSGVRDQLYLLAQVSRWLEGEGLDPAALVSAAGLERYVVWRREQGYRRSLSPKSLRGLLGYLDGLGVLARDDAGRLPVEELLEAFGCYLVQERGLSPLAVWPYGRIARLFLAGRSEPLADDLARLSGADVLTFVLRESRRSPRSAANIVCGLRALLRFLHVRGLIAEPLAMSVPAVARRREDLPRGLAPGQVRLLLDSCDRCTAAGRRDYAILVLLCRLGLRCGEVAALELHDVDWRAGELVIRGKGGSIGWRCLAMLARRWWITFVTVARAGSGGRCL